jgi:hypothetical protein
LELLIVGGLLLVLYLLIIRPQTKKTHEKLFTQEKNGPLYVKLRWLGSLTNFQVLFDEKEVGSFPDQAAFIRGATFILPDGATLYVQGKVRLTGLEFYVTRNREPLCGSDLDPYTRMKNASQTVYVIGVVGIIAGVLAEVFQFPWLLALGVDLFAVLSGLLFVGLGFFTSRGSVLALIIAIAIYIAETVFFIYTMKEWQGNPPTTGVVLRVFFLLAMLNGLRRPKLEVETVSN